MLGYEYYGQKTVRKWASTSGPAIRYLKKEGTGTPLDAFVSSRNVFHGHMYFMDKNVFYGQKGEGRTSGSRDTSPAARLTSTLSSAPRTSDSPAVEDSFDPSKT